MRPAAVTSAQALASTLPALLLSARQVAASVAVGVHGRRRAGAGEQFWQYRRAQAGDSLSQIDWRASARSPHLLVREREWEAAQTALLWLDRSASMAWRSAPSLMKKEDYAQLLLLALADLLLRGGERVGWLGGERPVYGRGLLERLANQLERPPECTWPVLTAWPQKGQGVLVGDFLDDPVALKEKLTPLLQSGARGLLIQVLDPAEIEFPYKGRLRFTGPEAEAPYLASHSESLKAAYQARLAAQTSELQALIRPAGWQSLRVRTDALPAKSLLTLVEKLSLPC